MVDYYGEDNNIEKEVDVLYVILKGVIGSQNFIENKIKYFNIWSYF